VLDHFTAQVDGRTILKDLTFQLERRGVYAIMGPGGSGKSSLMGILGGHNRQTGGWTFTGECTYNGQPLWAGPRPVAIPQTLHRTPMTVLDFLRADFPDPAQVTEAQAQAMLERVRLARLCDSLHTETLRLQPALGDGEWWRLVIARALLRSPPLLCIDEPTAGLSDVEAALIIDVLKAEGLRRTVVFVTHNQQHARVISHRMMLLAGGRLQESETTEVFFSGPKSRAGQDYVRTGGCYVPSPDSPTDALSEEFQAGPVLPPAAPPEPAPEPAVSPPPAAPQVPEAPRVSEVLWPSVGKPLALSLRGFGLRVGTRSVLHELSFDLAERGLYVLGVPDGMARRMLSRALCGPRPVNFHIEGQARYAKGALSDENSPSTPQAGAQLLMMSVAGYIGSALAERSLSRPEQRAETVRLITEAGFPELLERLEIDMTSVEAAERRVLEILRAVTSAPAVVVLDEPLAGLPPGPRERVIAVLNQQAQQRAVLILSQDAVIAAELQAAQGWVLDGRTSAQAPPPPEPPPEPPPAPIVEPAAAVAVAEPAAAIPVATPEPVSVAAPARRFAGRGPRGFQWLRLGALAGMPAPGMTNDLAYDLDLIRNAGVSWLVTLTHEPLPADEVARHDLRGIQFPIVDMDVPTEESAARLCAQVAELVGQGQAVGFHCKAGLGRTGTMLACQLIWEGTTAAAALRDVRAVEPGWIQSEKQVAFLGQFEEWLKQMWPMEEGQRKKHKPNADVHLSTNPGAQLNEKKEKSNDPT
jgi:atypical dual specificity phosphatase